MADAPWMPVTWMLPPLEVILELVPVTRTPWLLTPPAMLPVPWTVTVPVPPALIWAPLWTQDADIRAVRAEPAVAPPMPVTCTFPPDDVIVPPCISTPRLGPPLVVLPVPCTVTVPAPPAVIWLLRMSTPVLPKLRARAAADARDLNVAARGTDERPRAFHGHAGIRASRADAAGAGHLQGSGSRLDNGGACQADAMVVRPADAASTQNLHGP